MPIYKQSVNARRMTGIRCAPPGEFIASYVGTSIGLCTAFLFMFRHLRYLLVLWLQYACNLLLQWHWKSHFFVL